jgi:two-component system heavy metal sensor histidine kinase CusS
MTSLSVRVKLTLLYSFITFTGLVLFGALTYWLLHLALIRGKESHLAGREVRLLTFLRDNQPVRTSTGLNELLTSYALVTHEGNLFYINNPDGSRFFPTRETVPEWRLPSGEDCEQPTYNTVTLDGSPALVMCHRATLNGHTVRLYIGGALDEEFYILRQYRDALLLLLPVLLVMASICGYLLSWHALKPVDRITRAAVEIGVKSLSSRLPVPQAKDEIHNLAIAWNQLLARLEAAVLRLSRFSADASHDIRTSITVMLATAELSLRRRRSEEEYRHDLEKIVAECRTATTLLDALLTLSQSDNFIHEVQFRPVNLGDLVVSGCRRVEDLAGSSNILLDWHLPNEPIHVSGDEVLLQRLLGILLDNAIRYTPPFGEIHVEVSFMDQGPLITVRDTGIGMPESVKDHIFDRFYQADLRELRSYAGNGLGLSIGRWIASAHRAVLSVESAPRLGSTFQIQFPLQGDSGALQEVAKGAMRA